METQLNNLQTSDSFKSYEGNYLIKKDISQEIRNFLEKELIMTEIGKKYMKEILNIIKEVVSVFY